MNAAVYASRPAFARAANVVLSPFRRPGLGHAAGAIGALGLFVATGFTCGNGSAPSSPSTLAPIMATGAARVPLTTAATEKKCPAK
ncbi:hypothetical protein [Variovorax sp. Sphag1AA]|uniref:hypothetical protein n=1 Tax=Variovorax sp. Sphag1AA TaxID=2587027 RepID=UPI00160A37D1|nr:hypothetical protein [Variovorax sp. Sphag1AA]MBB3177045.1 hypothetical protein [Variovorax sp. Sphag1AA]